MPRFLLDASVLYKVLENPRRYVEFVEESAILDLTIYEVGNAVMVSARRGLIDDPLGFLRGFKEVVGLVEVIPITVNDIGEIAKIALETGLTYYDAAYVYKARRHNLVLLTEDKEILRKAPDVSKSLEHIAG
ncbi:type II toxin-antitoxin system VapC family toxin [Pyrofollis japonicus]|uniref:type II toxin-antitoxin system VapC family toxin n=1 Tax=Pyrofollis japonicus TaxID=3060460 RepID=UPI00295A815A|nr:type II toxin-antitoxin system VapC family toxin [Pyrofollis japonicus]BEP17847.1 type II toxin-antitoxin system VapC family toxin [Pyrofollis japonicus]